MENSLDKIRQKRQESAANDAEAAKTQAIIDAVKSSGGDTKDSLTSAMHDILMATMVGKDPRLAEVATNLSKLLESIAKAGDDLKNSGLDSIPQTFNELLDALRNLPSQVAETDKSPQLIPHLQEINKSIRASKTIITPNVQAAVDLSPVSRVLKEHFDRPVKKSIDLGAYKAQDLDNDGDTTQYVGFVNPEGAWYIIENDVEGTSLRYKFGKDGYKKAWEVRVGQNYTLLNEAIHAVRT